MATSTGNTKRTKKIHQHQVTLSGEAPILAAEQMDYDPQQDLTPEPNLYEDAMDDNMDHRVHVAQERLSRLRKEQEEIEREKAALEDLRRKQQSFIQGRTEMMDRLSRSIGLLDREMNDNRRKLEQMMVMRESFADHVESVNSLTPEDWSRQNLQSELSRALAVIEDAKLEYDRSMVRLQAYTQAPVQPAPANTSAPTGQLQSLFPTTMDRQTFRQWAFLGLAFTTPVLILAAVTGLLKLIF
jgi:chromosome segregation ATPase